MSAGGGGKPWSLVHHVCLKSALERIRPEQVYLYSEFEPSGPWWDLSRELLTVQQIEAPREIFGNPVVHFAHRADIVRLDKLLSTGGIYLDADVFVHKSFDDLLHHSAVLGRQVVEGRNLGLCNAVILAQSEAPFLKRWHSEYRTFRSVGRDIYWDEHSVQVPNQLAEKYPNEITILAPSAFFWPTYEQGDLDLMFKSAVPIDVTQAYANHLWESLAWEPYLEHLTPGRVRSVDSNFHQWIRPFVETLPDEYGAATITSRVARGLRQLKQRVRS
jgi:hypothetical protein